ncbi:MAG: glycosyltransferase family 2 protein [Actinomycetota bacterium]|nr:glycosyltransferase family 2 protein [Actinomycetota bacterium]
MVNKGRVIALIPTFNEAERISATVKAAKRIAALDDVYVVDDASSDETVSLAKESGAEVFINERNLGKGASLNGAIARLDFDVILLLDGDLGESAIEGEKLLAPILAGEADMAIADFPKAKRKGGFGLVKGVARWGIEKLAGQPFDEPLSGQRAIKREVLVAVGPFEGGFGVETALTIDALKKGFKVIEVKTGMSHAETGRDIKGFIHRGRQLMDVIRVIIKRLG